MSLATATLSSKYQISIPKEIRESLNLKPGQKLVFLNTGAGVRLVAAPEPKDLFGLLKNVQSKTGEAVDTDFVRDRSTRREDILPTTSKGSNRA